MICAKSVSERKGKVKRKGKEMNSRIFKQSYSPLERVKLFLISQLHILYLVATFVFVSVHSACPCVYICVSVYAYACAKVIRERCKQAKWCRFFFFFFPNCCAYISIDHAAIHNTWLVNKVGIFDP